MHSHAERGNENTRSVGTRTGFSFPRSASMPFRAGQTRRFAPTKFLGVCRGEPACSPGTKWHWDYAALIYPTIP